jgi:hypothetical protein
MAQSTENKSITTGIGISGGIIGRDIVKKSEYIAHNLPSIDQIREKLSFRHEDRMFYWRGHALAEGAYDPDEKVYRISLITGMETFPTFGDAREYIDKNKEDILSNILKAAIEEEEDD